MPNQKRKVTWKLTSDLLDVIALEPEAQTIVVERVMRKHYAKQGIKIGYTVTPETRGGNRGGGRPPTKVSFRCPMPTPEDIGAMLIFQSHYRPEHQLAKGKQGKEARAKIKHSLTKYGEYLRVATIGDRIVGTVGVYPVEQSAIAGVLSGQLDDSVLIPSPGGEACYISGINILPSRRRSRRVIHGLMAEIAKAIATLTPTIVYAQPATPEGKRMALRLGFTECVGQAPSDDPLYECFAADAVDVWQRLAIRGI